MPSSSHPRAGGSACSRRTTCRACWSCGSATTAWGSSRRRCMRIFDAFEQAERTLTRHFGGLGFGAGDLPALVEMHQGSLTASSGEGPRGRRSRCGCRRLHHPPRRASPPVRRAAPAGKASGSCSSRTTTTRCERCPTAAVPRSPGHGVGSVQEAREVSGRERFDLLISDIGLPDGSGFEVMRHLRTTQPVRGIALSGFGRAEDLRNSREAGFDHHLTKPVDFQSLEEPIRDVAVKGSCSRTPRTPTSSGTRSGGWKRPWP